MRSQDSDYSSGSGPVLPPVHVAFGLLSVSFTPWHKGCFCLVLFFYWCTASNKRLPEKVDIKKKVSKVT